MAEFDDPATTFDLRLSGRQQRCIKYIKLGESYEYHAGGIYLFLASIKISFKFWIEAKIFYGFQISHIYYFGLV